MSRVIKPDDREFLGLVRKFEKEAFAPDGESKELRLSANPYPPLNDNPGPNHEAKLKSPEDLIAEARREAEKIVREAKAEAAQIRKQECERGRDEGLKQVKKEMEEQLQVSSRLLESLMAQLKTQESDLMQLLSPRLANLATELAQKIIHREIEMDPSAVTVQTEQAIGKILEREKLIIRVNPGDEELMKAHKPVLARIFDGIDKIEVISDTKIERGGCVVETNLVRVDAQPSSQLETARKTLLEEAGK